MVFWMFVSITPCFCVLCAMQNYKNFHKYQTNRIKITSYLAKLVRKHIMRQFRQHKPDRQKVQKKWRSMPASPLPVPRAGIEPAHLAVLVFETNASTYSAIWA